MKNIWERINSAIFQWQQRKNLSIIILRLILAQVIRHFLLDKFIRLIMRGGFKSFRDEKVTGTKPQEQTGESRVTTNSRVTTARPSRTNLGTVEGLFSNSTLGGTQARSSTNIGRQSLSTSRSTLIGKKELEPKAVLPEDIEKIKQENTELKMMELSSTCKNALKLVQRYDSVSYSLQVERVLKEIIQEEQIRLKKVQNGAKQMRTKTYDNELTVNVINNQLRVVTDINKQMAELKKIKELYDKDQLKKKEQEFRANRDVKTREVHSQNIKAKLDQIVGRIQKLLSVKDYERAYNVITTEFVKKYEKEQYASEKLYYYKLISEAINENIQMEKCLEEVTKILWALSMADLNETEACLRSLNANHKDFNYLQTKYKGEKKTSGKQMISILTHLEKFNDHIIKYLEAVKANQKIRNKPDNTRSIEEKYEREIEKIKATLEEQKRKSAVMYNEMQKKKFKNEGMSKDVTELETIRKNQKDFGQKISAIIERINDGKDWQKDFDLLRKDRVFSKQKPYSYILNFEELLHRIYNRKIEKEVKRMIEIFDEVRHIFKKKKLSHQMRFQNVAKVLEAPAKRNPHLVDLRRKLEALMLTIIERTKQDAEEDRVKKLQKEKLNVENQLKEEKKKTRRLSQQISEISFDRAGDDMSDDGSRSSLSRTPLGSRGGSRSGSQIGTPYNRSRSGTPSRSRRGSFDIATPVGITQKEYVEKIQVCLNRTSTILLQKNANSYEFKLTEIENLFEKSIKKNPKQQKTLQVLSDWIGYIMPRLLIKAPDS